MCLFLSQAQVFLFGVDICIIYSKQSVCNHTFRKDFGIFPFNFILLHFRSSLYFFFPRLSLSVPVTLQIMIIDIQNVIFLYNAFV